MTVASPAPLIQFPCGMKVVWTHGEWSSSVSTDCLLLDQQKVFDNQVIILIFQALSVSSFPNVRTCRFPVSKYAGH